MTEDSFGNSGNKGLSPRRKKLPATIATPTKAYFTLTNSCAQATGSRAVKSSFREVGGHFWGSEIRAEEPNDQNRFWIQKKLVAREGLEPPTLGL